MASSSSSSAHQHKQQQRSILGIDLNEIPSPSETLPSPSTSFILSPTSLVRSIHDNPQLPEGPPAEIPGDPSPGSLCGGCGGPPPQATAERLVCDACERAFHFVCAGVSPALLPILDDWLCPHCAGEGLSTRRWPLGRPKDKLLDMNASPPSDADADNAAPHDRKHAVGENAFRGYASGGPLLYSNFIYSSNGFGLHKVPGLITHTTRLEFQDVLHHRFSIARSFEDIAYSSQLGRIRSSNTSFRYPSRNPNEVLQSLREFVSERNGVLEEGWHVEFKQSKNGCESYAVYRAPDGSIFETMSDVACYLGLSNGNPVEAEARGDDGSFLRRNGLHLPKRRKITRFPVGNGFTENGGSLISGCSNSFLSPVQTDQFNTCKHEKMAEVAEPAQEENGADDIRQFHEGLPLQYEDFFILSLGKIDARTSYHNSSQIWPVGYRSCWHDKITGSLFLCDVLDGGDTGPVFKVRRFSCSALPIPYGSTVLSKRHCLKSDSENKEESEMWTIPDDDCNIERILSDPDLPVEGDALSFLLSNSKEIDGQDATHSNAEACNSHEVPQEASAESPPVGEKIGEFSVDGRSASVVWSILSQKLADACHIIYKQMGSLKFFCKHVLDGTPPSHDVMNDKNRSSLDKFCSLLGSVKVLSCVKSDEELDAAIEALKSWMDADRFGLDAEFVQELIEQSPISHKCMQYEHLRRRNDYSKLPLVGNGLLLINGKCIDQCQPGTVLDGLYRDYKTNREPTTINYSRPPGKHLGMKLPQHLVGDVLQVWELLCRFHEILSLDPLDFDKLEGELISPWFKSLCDNGPCEKVGDQVGADGSSLPNEQTSLSNKTDESEENRFINMEPLEMSEEPQRQALSSYSKCACVSLRRAHVSLLDVLVSELQIKVAAVVDPSIDGESKSRRGRRKDVDSSILAIRPKLNLLPINELTWPELARRYALAVLSMDGNLDFTDTGGRECGKVFRCLQGDGGVLCGSLVGLAGIEADAKLLAEASKRIYGVPTSEHDLFTVEDDDPDPVGASGRAALTNGDIPEWAQPLEPVRKLPTNVGTRIRKCVYEALEKDPPDWARKILEHSISKEVYKGNASGPTKKAVLSVLADVVKEGSLQKTQKEKKKKTVVSISEIIMRQCRVLLRRVALADEEKVFCNLLGRNLMNSSENDEEGLLGSPAMVSRPLDFRTIDLRLAVGVYGGSHEAFLEDVRELWKTIRIAHADQPDLIQLAETLSQKFESLFEEELVPLVEKLVEYSKMEQITAEAKKEMEGIIASARDIPKAPWEEGVCKVCGIDKDDDSVLLCDACDAEYHTYCLNPPLARIPEGNWYCPSCVSGVNMLEGMAQGAQFIGQRHRRKYYGEGIRNYLEELGRLASVMEQRDYWEFSVDERILLLKFLCDEVLNSILIRQHLEHCFETSADLQQKLRLLHSEWKSLKLREDLLATKAAKLGFRISDMAAETNMEEHTGAVADHNICSGPQPVASDRCDQIGSTPETAPKAKSAVDTVNSSGKNGCQNANHKVKGGSCSNEVKQPEDSSNQVDDIEGVNEDSAGPEINERSSKRHKSSSVLESPVSNSLACGTSGIDSESSCQGAVSKSEDLQGASASSSTSNELQACKLDLLSVQKDLSSLQQSIASAELQLLKSSVRMEFLGSDSSGRLYWASAHPGGNPWVIVDGTMASNTQGMANASMVSSSFSIGSSLCTSGSHLNLQGSNAPCPFVYGQDCMTRSCSPWIFYESDNEIRELVKSLKDSDSKERELKDSILHWQKLRFHDSCQTGKQDQVSQVVSTSTEQDDAHNLATKASTVLEHKYGPFFEEDAEDCLKKRGKRSRVIADGKLYRCKCLEPIWLSRHHCLSCHRTFFTAEELDQHKDRDCKPNPSLSGKKKATDETLCSLSIKSSTHQHVQNEELMCPYKFDEISTKFVTNDSIKELVHGIGLIGSEGTPLFVPSVSPYLSDPALTVLPCESAIVAVDESKVPGKEVGGSDQTAVKGHVNNVPDVCPRRVPAKKHVVDPQSAVPECSLRPLVGRAAQILRQLKVNLLDMDAALPEEAFRGWKVQSERRRAWHAFVKAAETIFEMIQATFVFEDMIKSEYLKNEWWYWSSLSAAAKTSTLSSLALRIYAMDNAIVYERIGSNLSRMGSLKISSEEDYQSLSNMGSSEKSKQSRRSSKKRKEADG